MSQIRPQAEINVPVDAIEYWHFVPYKSAKEYTVDNPLYGVIVIYEHIGDVMVYSEPGTGGAFHSLDPEYTDSDIYPPTDEFKTALVKFISQPDKTQDLSEFISQMYPWEHHFFNRLTQLLNTQPMELPPEIHYIIEDCASDILNIEISKLSDLGPEEEEMFSV